MASPWQLAIKFGLDWTVACIALVGLSPAFLLIGLMIRIEDGYPVFFRQKRLGRGGRPFVIWKFRTMVPDADRLLDGGGRVPARGRVTRVGRLLRATSLDELPQLINILCGEMSLVGPRPGLVEHYDRYTERQRGRYQMRPGVTGLAQVNGRNTLLWSKRIELDLQYAREFSLWLDMKILWRTILVVCTGRGLVLDRNPEQVDDLPGRGDIRHE